MSNASSLTLPTGVTKLPTTLKSGPWKITSQYAVRSSAYEVDVYRMQRRGTKGLSCFLYVRSITFTASIPSLWWSAIKSWDLYRASTSRSETIDMLSLSTGETSFWIGIVRCLRWLEIVMIIIIIIIIINCNWVVTRWQWSFYMYTKYEIGYY